MQVKSIAECSGPREHSAILLIFIKPPFVLKIFDLSIFEWPLKTVIVVPLFGAAYAAPNKAPQFYTHFLKLISLVMDSSISEVEF